MFELLALLVIDTVAYFFGWLFRRLTGSVRTRLSYADRLRRICVIRRNRAIRRFLKRSSPSAAIPAIGLTCPACDYSLTGLVDRICPECGKPFDLENMIDTSVER